MSDKAKPVHKIQYNGITLAIWKNEGKNGTFYSTTISRSYKQGEAWGESDSFGYCPK